VRVPGRRAAGFITAPSIFTSRRAPSVSASIRSMRASTSVESTRGATYLFATLLVYGRPEAETRNLEARWSQALDRALG